MGGVFVSSFIGAGVIKFIILFSSLGVRGATSFLGSVTMFKTSSLDCSGSSSPFWILESANIRISMIKSAIQESGCDNKNLIFSFMYEFYQDIIFLPSS